jgi:hypothetical protein
VRDLQAGVELVADAVADELANDAVPGRRDRSLDRAADLVDAAAGAHVADAGVQGGAGGATRSRDTGSTSPTRKVALVSPWTPPMKDVTSTLTMSPSARRRLSGMPWQMISLTEVQSDLG